MSPARRRDPVAAHPRAPRAETATPRAEPWFGPAWALASLAIAVLPLAAWLDRGFDLTDEGSYLLGFRHPRDVFLTLTHFQPLVAALTGHRPWPVLFYRVLGLALAVIPAACFGLQVFRFAGGPERSENRGRAGRWLALAAFTALGSLLGYSSGPRSLSYNGLNGALTLTEAAFALMLLRADATAPAAGRGFRLAILLGLALGAQFVVKATSATMMVAWLLAAILFVSRSALRRRLAPPPGAPAGVAAFAAGFFGAVVPYSTWWSGISMHREASQAHSLLGLLASSVAPVGGQLAVAGPLIAIAIALVVTGQRLAAAGKRRTLAATCLGGGATLVIAAALVGGATPGGINREVHGSTPFGMLIALALTLWFVARPRRGGRDPAHATATRRTRLFVLLLVLPAAGALGTNNPLTVAVALGLAPWFAIMWLIAEESPAHPGRVWTQLVVVAAALIAVAEVGESQLVTPYRIAGGMPAQQLAFSRRIEAGAGLRVDADTRQLVESARDLLDKTGFRPGDPVLVFYDLPGLTYLVGGRSPILPWYFANSDTLTCRALGLASAELGRGRAYLFVRNGLSPLVAQCLREAGIREHIATLGTIHTKYYGDLYVIARIPPAGTP